MRVMSCLVLLCLVIGSGLLAFAQAPAGKGWVDRFDVDKKDLVSVGSNDHFRLEPGYVLVLEKGKVRLVITVLDETRLVDGVETRVVEERESKSGRLLEISRNYFAFNTADRGVYYFGEEVDIYKNGKVVGHEGAWESGKGGARFGLMIPGRPVVGARFYQEVAPGVAMDRAEVAALDASLSTPAGEFKGCLKVIETTPLEPLARESKIYAPGIGLVKDGPLLLVEYGRNVAFQQTTDIVQRLRAKGDVEIELMIAPDEPHEFLLHRNRMEAYERTFEFIDRHIGGKRK